MSVGQASLNESRVSDQPAEDMSHRVRFTIPGSGGFLTCQSPHATLVYSLAVESADNRRR
jgi:hypothetical protein